MAKLDTGCSESIDSIKKLDIIKVGDNFCINSHDFDAISALKNGESNTLSPATVTPVLSDRQVKLLVQNFTTR